MADSFFAPHLKKWPASLATSVERVMQTLKDDYIPRNIQGGKATWVVTSNETPLAIVAQQWRRPKVIDKNVTVESLRDEDGNLTLHVGYRCQEDPERVFKEFERKQ